MLPDRLLSPRPAPPRAVVLHAPPPPAPTPPARTAGAMPSARLAAFDALKALTTVLVVFHHAALTYGAIGGWFYREQPPGSSLTLTIFCTVNQAWFMGLFFLLAGYFTPGSLARKGRAAFVRDRALRLGLPTAAFALVIGPLSIVLVQAVLHDHRPSDVLAALWARGVYEPGPLWFAQALLGLSLATAAAWPWLARRPVPPFARPAVPAVGRLLALAVATGAAAFVLRLAWPVGETVAGMQLGFFASYVVLFVLGLLGAPTQALQRIPEASARRLRRVAAIVLPTLLPLALLGSWFPVFAEPSAGGWTLPAAMHAFWEPLVAAGALAVLLRASLARLDLPPPWLEWLGRHAYAVFVVHAPVLVAIGLAMRPLELPPLLKFVLLGASGTAVSAVLAGALLRVPGMRRVL